METFQNSERNRKVQKVHREREDMTSSACPGLSQLPAEILCSILQYLNPAGLISVSQTNVRLRFIIQPNKLDFCERLLFLESLQENGTTPIYNARSNELQPAWSELEWQSMLWACSDCLRMLPHTAFDNHSILGLGYRKPIPGSSAVTKFTSWQPGSTEKDPTAERTWRQRHHPGIGDEIQIAQKRYRVAITHIKSSRGRDDVGLNQRLTKFQEHGMVVFAEMTLEEFIQLSEDEETDLLSQEARCIELAYCGYKRHERRCNECRYQRNEFGLRVGASFKTPVIRSRRVWCPSEADRHFPGFAFTLDIKNARGEPNFAVYPRDTEGADHWWTTYMIRCSGCSKWKEAHLFPRAYRNWGWRPSNSCLYHTDFTDEASHPEEAREEEARKWDTAPLNQNTWDHLRCNHCFVLDHGRQAFETDVLDRLKILLDRQKTHVATDLWFKFQGIRDGSFGCPQKWRSEIYDITDPPREIWANGGELSDGDIAAALYSWKKWIRFLERTKNTGRHRDWHGVQGPFDGMRRDHEERMAHHTCMKAVCLEVQKQDKVEKLTELALEDNTRFLYLGSV